MPVSPPAPDYYMVIGLASSGEAAPGVWGAAQVFVAAATQEEEAVEKVAPLVPDATLFTAQVTPTFPPPPEEGSS